MWRKNMDRIAQALKRAREDNTLNMDNNTLVDRSAQISSVTPPTIPIRSITVSDMVLRKNKILCGYDNDPIVDAYRLLRTRVLRQMSANNRRSIGITSTSAQEGKSVTAINLGIAIAMESEHKAIVVDTDLRRPTTHKYFGLQLKSGINDYLSGSTPFEELLVSPGIEGFAILPCIDPIPGAPELLKSEKMHELVTNLKKSFPEHTIIYDLPPALIGDDAVAFSSLVDAMILVIEDGATDKQRLKETKELLSDANLIGTVLNKVSSTKANSKDYYY